MILLALDWLRPFDACGDGCGHRYGYGDGDGSGDGYGNGHNSGYGHGNGSGGGGCTDGAVRKLFAPAAFVPPCVSQMYLLAQVLEDP